MLTSPDSFLLVDQKALHLLRGFDNPFEILARPQRGDESFASTHVPDFQLPERSLLLRMIDWYRLDEIHSLGEIRPSRAVWVFGARGAGKTHMLQSLVARPDRKAQILIRPAYFEKSLDFEEYLLGQLKNALQEQDEFHAERPLEILTATIARRLLKQAILGASPVDRLFALRPSKWRLFLWGGGEKHLRRYDQLLEKLSEPLGLADFPRLLAAAELPPDMAFRLVQGHLNAYEAGTGIGLAMRRMLYRSMSRRAFLGDDQALPTFLNEDYRQAEPSGTASRTELVAALLQVLIETCCLVQMPIVFAFDNFERFLSPQNQFDPDLTRAFFNSLAQAVDNVRGILFLLFVEGGLFDSSIGPNMDSFAQARLLQGVPVEGKGPIHKVQLNPPLADDVLTLVRSRVRPLLDRLQLGEDLPPHFPFSHHVIADLGQGTSFNLRDILWRLRDDYSRAVYNQEPPAPAPAPANGDGIVVLPPVDFTQVMESAWKKAREKARQQWKQNAAGQQDLHAGLKGLLQALLPVETEQWAIQKVISSEAVGEDPEYGMVTTLQFKLREGQPLDGNPQNLKVAIGFLVARGRGMANDLRAKFGFFEQVKKGGRLVILWPVESKTDDPVDQLPGLTRSAWNDAEEHHWKTEVRRISESLLLNILACTNFPNLLESQGQGLPSPEEQKTFLRQKVDGLVPLLMPPMERTPAHEN